MRGGAENVCNQLVLSCDKTTDDIVKWLQGIFK